MHIFEYKTEMSFITKTNRELSGAQVELSQVKSARCGTMRCDPIAIGTESRTD